MIFGGHLAEISKAGGISKDEIWILLRPMRARLDLVSIRCFSPAGMKRCHVGQLRASADLHDRGRKLMPQPTCWWCDKSGAEAAMLIQGIRGAFICDECAELCVEIARRKKEGRPLIDEAQTPGLPESVKIALVRLEEGMTKSETAHVRPPPLPR
jgi:hypothetical protein